jgi:hypothetical protein
MIGFIDTLLTQYWELQAITALSLFYTYYSSWLHKHCVSQSSLVVSRQRIYIQVSLSLQMTHEVFFSQPNSFLAIILQLPIPKARFNSMPLLPSSYPGRLDSRNSTLQFMFWLVASKSKLCHDRRSVGQAPIGDLGPVFFSVWELRVCWCGTHSLTRGLRTGFS